MRIATIGMSVFVVASGACLLKGNWLLYTAERDLDQMAGWHMQTLGCLLAASAVGCGIIRAIYERRGQAVAGEEANDETRNQSH